MDEKEFLNEVKLNLKLDGDEEDAIVSSLILAGKEYLKNAGIKENMESALYKLAIKTFVAQKFESRLDDIQSKNTSNIFSMNSIIIQLKCCQ
ncbi:MAG: head-tail connector protein [Paraclostridium sp.]